MKHLSLTLRKTNSPVVLLFTAFIVFAFAFRITLLKEFALKPTLSKTAQTLWYF
jgi:hypothetical protein